MLEEDVLVDQSRRKRERDSEKSRADIEAVVRATRLACHMASGMYVPTHISDTSDVQYICMYL